MEKSIAQSVTTAWDFSSLTSWTFESAPVWQLSESQKHFSCNLEQPSYLSWSERGWRTFSSWMWQMYHARNKLTARFWRHSMWPVLSFIYQYTTHWTKDRHLINDEYCVCINEWTGFLIKSGLKQSSAVLVQNPWGTWQRCLFPVMVSDLLFLTMYIFHFFFPAVLFLNRVGLMNAIKGKFERGKIQSPVCFQGCKVKGGALDL